MRSIWARQRTAKHCAIAAAGNQRRDEPQPLSAGDVLRAGSVDVKVGVIAALGSTETGVNFPDD